MRPSRLPYAPRILAILSIIAATACTGTVGPVDGGGGDTATRIDSAADSGSLDVRASDAPVDGARVQCGSSTCTADQVCCAATGLCYDPACLSCCMPRPDSGSNDVTATDTGNTDAGRSCRAASECATGEDCVFGSAGCTTTGVCTRHLDCGRPSLPYCGCDGITFQDHCEGVPARWVHAGACTRDAGTTDSSTTTPCRTDTDCGGSGLVCCTGTGLCYDARCDACCRIAPTDAGVPGACRGDTDCTAGRVCCTGTGVCYDPACLGCCRPTAGCTDNSMCSRSQYCAASTCGGTGTCVDRPGICTDVFRPVCGCDGVTYSNSCYAASAGVVVASDGSCATSTRDSGIAPMCRSDGDCAAGRVCCTGTGVCYDPACLGCCRPTAGCTDNSMCSRSQYCAASTCGGTGTCADRPGICTGLFRPVCGCDGVTYSNACFAASAGAVVASDGPCATSTPDSGIAPMCRSDVDCTAGRVCCTGSGRCYDPACLACCAAGG